MRLNYQSSSRDTCLLPINFHKGKAYSSYPCSNAQMGRTEPSLNLQKQTSTPSSSSQYIYIYLMNYYRIISLPLFQDNYSYIIQGTAPNLLALIDPAQPQTVLSFLKNNLPTYLVSHILYTHHHYDHAGGSQELVPILSSMYPALEVYAGTDDASRIFGVTKSISAPCEMSINQSQVKIHLAQCHTRGHLLYEFVSNAVTQEQDNLPYKEISPIRTVRSFLSNRCLFTGDTLFSAGIGKFFEGNAIDMHSILNNMHAQISPNVDIYCGHQYTLHNLRWAKLIEDNNQDIIEMQKMLEKQSTKGEICTIPTNLEREKKINVFYRAALGITFKEKYGSSLQALRVLRQMKNQGKTAHL